MEFMKFRKTDSKFRAAFKKEQVSDFSIEYYEVRDRSMRYIKRTGAKEDLPLIIFAHGSPGSSNDYFSYLVDDTLHRASHMITVDRPGFGFSGFGKPVPSLADQSAMLKPIIEKEGKKSVVLVGHSYGGPLVVRMAMDYPELVDGLVMIAPSIDPDLEPREWWRKPLNVISFLVPDAFICSNKEIMTLEEDLREILPKWADLSIPVTVIQGDKDNLVPAGNARFATKMMPQNPDLKVDMVKNGNHFILWSETERIKNAILEMVEEND